MAGCNLFKEVSMRNPARFLLAAAALLALGGCFTRESANVYNKSEARREHTVRLATVDAVRKVAIEGSRTGIGMGAGGAAGGISGSGVGAGTGSATAAVLGAVAGGVAGGLIEERITRKDALEVTVRFDNGEMRAIVQEADVELKPGQRVRLVTAGGVTRVTP
jgi:outer membrane lipoprotein SlyB